MPGRIQVICVSQRSRVLRGGFPVGRSRLRPPRGLGRQFQHGRRIAGLLRVIGTPGQVAAVGERTLYGRM